VKFLSSVQAAIERASSFLLAARGWRRLLLGLVAGALSAVAFEPFLLWPGLLLGYAALVLLLDGVAAKPHPLRRAFFIGWAFGFGQFLVDLHWVGYAFLVDADAHAWQIPFVAILLPGGLALFPAVAALAYARFRREGMTRVFLFVFLFAAEEFLRGHVLTGFPWNLSAYGWGASLALLQSASIIGAYGLSLLTLLLAASLALVPERKMLLPATMAVLFLALWAGGMARLAYADNGTVEGVRLRIVQPDVPQSEKYLPQFTLRNWQRLLDLSRVRANARPTHMIWPEAAPPFILTRQPLALMQIGELTAGHTALLTGAVRVDNRPDGSRALYNSFYVFAPDGRLVATYDKFHLVPFGEYLPFQDIMDAWGLTKVTGGVGGFAAGAGPRTISIPGAPPASVLICYEIIFPGEVSASPRPAWLVNVTDDSWFGPGAGPLQHFLTARVRAIEEGLPIARAANTGISAMIDAYGRVRGQLPLGTQGALDAALPIALRDTFFVRFGPLMIFVLFMAMGVGAIFPLKHSSHLTR
jgi:apolipoprotein N-acyltransferase